MSSVVGLTVKLSSLLTEISRSRIAAVAAFVGFSILALVVVFSFLFFKFRDKTPRYFLITSIYKITCIALIWHVLNNALLSLVGYAAVANSDACTLLWRPRPMARLMWRRGTGRKTFCFFAFLLRMWSFYFLNSYFHLICYSGVMIWSLPFSKHYHVKVDCRLE